MVLQSTNTAKKIWANILGTCRKMLCCSTERLPKISRAFLNGCALERVVKVSPAGKSPGARKRGEKGARFVERVGAVGAALGPDVRFRGIRQPDLRKLQDGQGGGKGSSGGSAGHEDNLREGGLRTPFVPINFAWRFFGDFAGEPLKRAVLLTRFLERHNDVNI